MQFHEIKVTDWISGAQAVRLNEANALKAEIERRMFENKICLVSLEGVDEISVDFVNACFEALRQKYGTLVYDMYVKIIMPWIDSEMLPYLGNPNVQAQSQAAA